MDNGRERRLTSCRATDRALRRTSYAAEAPRRIMVAGKNKNETNQLLQAEADLLVRVQLREVWGGFDDQRESGESLVGSDSGSAAATVEVVVEGSSRPKPRYIRPQTDRPGMQMPGRRSEGQEEARGQGGHEFSPDFPWGDVAGSSLRRTGRGEEEYKRQGDRRSGCCSMTVKNGRPLFFGSGVCV